MQSNGTGTTFARYGRGDVGEVSFATRSGGAGIGGYNACALVVVLCFVYLDLANYVYTLNPAWLPRYLFYAYVVVLLPLLLSKARLVGLYLVSPFGIWAGVLIAVSLPDVVDALIRGGDGGELVARRIQYVILAVVLGFACSTAPRALLYRTFSVLAIGLPALALFDFLAPGVLYPLDADGVTLGRPGATLINSNRAGEAMLLTFLLAIPALRPNVRAVLLLVVACGLIVTFSRAGLLGWLLLGTYLILIGVVPRYVVAVLLLAAASLPMLVGIFETYLEGRADIAQGLANLHERLAFFQDPALDDFSATERVQVLIAGMEMFSRDPLFGAGGGATTAWSAGAGTHNLPVMLAAENGVVGVALWLWLIVILWTGSHFRDKRLQIAMAALFVFASMFTHNMFDSLYWLLTFAIVAARPRA